MFSAKDPDTRSDSEYHRDSERELFQLSHPSSSKEYSDKVASDFVDAIVSYNDRPYYCRVCCPARNERGSECGHMSVFGKSLEQCRKDKEYHTEEYERKCQADKNARRYSGGISHPYAEGTPEARWSRR